MSGVPTVTVLIPARNEENDIERCLRAVQMQDHPHDRMEIVLVDGGSNDRTTAVAAKVLADGDIDWRIVDNPTGTTPSNLNAGLAVATGEVLCRVDARSIIPPAYVRLCTSVLRERPDVVVTGGAQVTVAIGDSAPTAGMARALNNRYAMGGSRYRSGAETGPTDTVYLGSFRVDQLRAAGGWDERMLTNQDFELNRRLGRAGLVWFDSRLEVGYVPRRTVRDLWKQYHRFGRWKVRYWRITGDVPRVRQLMPLVGVPVVAALGATVVHRVGGRRAAVTVPVVAAGLLLAIDAAGSEAPDAIEDRVVGAMATGTVATAWLTGVYRELLMPAGPEPPAERP